MDDKYGFVYIWRDRKHNRYYIGCRWGRTNDGYICSSPWMRQAYKHRPYDFKRKILSKVYTNRTDLLEQEHYWLNQIKQHELGKKYYNIHNYHFSHWSTDPDKAKAISEKASKRMKGARIGTIPWNKGIKYPVHLRERMAKSETARQKMSEAHKGKPSPHKGKKRNYSTEVRLKMGHMRGKTVPRDLVERRRVSIKQLIWITNGQTNKRVKHFDPQHTADGFVKGRTI